MTKPKLVIGSKAYSSWSLRPWMVLTHFGVAFEEVVVELDAPDTRERLLEYSPSARAPVLIHDGVTIWDSLAIIEYVAETWAELPVWPRDKAARAMARALSAEMHSGFSALRAHCPTQFARGSRKRALTSDVEADVRRIEEAWRAARARFGAGGPFLFGAFSAADAMFAPVVNRFQTYEIDVASDAKAFMQAIMDLPEWGAWTKAAEAEPRRNAAYEAL
jgi:glutathione S-transferase